MSRFTKGLLFGAVIGGLTTLLTMEKNGAANRRQLTDDILSTSKDLQRLTTGTSHLNVLKTALQEEILPQTQAIVLDITDTVTKFQQMNQPRLNRVQWRLQQLQDHLNHSKE